MIRKLEFILFGGVALALAWSLSTSVAVPFVLLSLAFAGMAYVDTGPRRAMRMAPEKPRLIRHGWPRAVRCLLLGVVCASTSISGALVVVATA